MKWIDPRQLELNEYSSNSLKDCVLEVDFAYLKKLRELYKDHPWL